MISVNNTVLQGRTQASWNMAVADPDLQVRGSKTKGGAGPLPWIRYCIVSLSKVNLILYGA